MKFDGEGRGCIEGIRHLRRPAAAIRADHADFHAASVDHPRRFGLGQPFSAGRAVHDASIAACVGEGHAWYPTVVDGGRSIVSLLASPGQHFGLAVVARAIGIVLNNGTMWFDPMPGRVNSLAPGRRVMTAGATAIMRRDGQALLAVGAPCGRRMIPAVLHAIVNRVDHGMDPQDAMKPSPPATSAAWLTTITLSVRPRPDCPRLR